MYQLLTASHVCRLHKVSSHSYMPPFQGLWVDTYISELPPQFPDAGMCCPNVAAHYRLETASQASGAYVIPATILRSQKKEDSSWPVHEPHIIGFGIRPTTIRSIISH